MRQQFGKLRSRALRVDETKKRGKDFPAFRAGDGRHRRGPDPGELPYDCFYLLKFDPHSVDFALPVLSPQKSECLAVDSSDHISAAIKPSADEGRIRNELS